MGASGGNSGRGSVARGRTAGGRLAGGHSDSDRVASGGISGWSGGSGGWVRGLHLKGMRVRPRSSLTLPRALEGSESGWIVTRRRPREPLTLSCEPNGDRVAVHREPWDSDRDVG